MGRLKILRIKIRDWGTPVMAIGKADRINSWGSQNERMSVSYLVSSSSFREFAQRSLPAPHLSYRAARDTVVTGKQQKSLPAYLGSNCTYIHPRLNEPTQVISLPWARDCASEKSLDSNAYQKVWLWALSKTASQPGVDLPPRGHLAISGDIFIVTTGRDCACIW